MFIREVSEHDARNNDRYAQEIIVETVEDYYRQNWDYE